MMAVRHIPSWIAIPLLLASAGRAFASQPVIMIISSSNVAAFVEAVDGVRSGLGASDKTITVDLAASDKSMLDPRKAAAGKDVRMVVAIGTNALSAALKLGIPVVSTMVLREDLAGQQSSVPARSPVGAVVLDLSLTDVLSGLARVFPGKTRGAASGSGRSVRCRAGHPGQGRRHETHSGGLPGSGTLAACFSDAEVASGFCVVSSGRRTLQRDYGKAAHSGFD